MITLLAVHKLSTIGNGDQIEVHAERVKLAGGQFCVDEVNHRVNDTPYRRALVHNEKDGLTINWGLDYPGGVAIGGDVEVPGLLAVHKLSTVGKANEIEVAAFRLRQRGADLCLDYPPRRSNDTAYRRALVHDPGDGLTLNWANDYPGGMTLNGAVKIPQDLTVGVLKCAGVDVGDALQQVSAKTVAIQTQIDELIALVAKLQSEVDELKP